MSSCFMCRPKFAQLLKSNREHFYYSMSVFPINSIATLSSCCSPLRTVMSSARKTKSSVTVFSAIKRSPWLLKVITSLDQIWVVLPSTSMTATSIFTYNSTFYTQQSIYSLGKNRPKWTNSSTRKKRKLQLSRPVRRRRQLRRLSLSTSYPTMNLRILVSLAWKWYQGSTDAAILLITMYINASIVKSCSPFPLHGIQTIRRRNWPILEMV